MHHIKCLTKRHFRIPCRLFTKHPIGESALDLFISTYFFHYSAHNSILFYQADFLLASSAVPGLYLFFKEYIAANLHTATHLKARLVNITLLVVCGAISLLFMISMVCELAQDGSLSK